MGCVSKVFDRVIVINLERRRQRLDRLWSHLGEWPFKKPQRFNAVDGRAVGAPATWDKGPGAWGCRLSHLAVLDAAIVEGLSNVLVLEDDAYPVVDFAPLAQEFLVNVPGDWDCIMLGAQHLLPPRPITPGVVRCVASNRMHAYAVRGRFMKLLRDAWTQNRIDHCDIVLSSLMPQFRVYAPDPLLIGQDAGESDITGFRERLRFLSSEHLDKIAATDPGNASAKLFLHLPTLRRMRTDCVR